MKTEEWSVQEIFLYDMDDKSGLFKTINYSNAQGFVVFASVEDLQA